MSIDKALEAAQASLSPAAAARIRASVQQAADIIAPLWPLERFVAVNPLRGFEDRPFEVATQEAARLFGGRGYLPLADYQAALASGRIGENALRRAFDDRFGTDGATIALGATSAAPRDLLWARLTRTAARNNEIPAARLSAARRALSAIWTPARAQAEGTGSTDRAAAWIDGQVNKICAAFFDTGLAALPMPGRAKGFYPAWRAFAPHDPDLRRHLGASGTGALRRLPERPEAIIHAALARAGARDSEARHTFLTHALAALPGWAGYIKQRHVEGASPEAPADLVGFLAVRLALWLLDAGGKSETASEGTGSEIAAPSTGAPPEAAVIRLAAVAGLGDLADTDLEVATPEALARLWDEVAGIPDETLCAVFLSAAEESYRSGLMTRLAPRVPADPAWPRRPSAQAVFCIDVRSEVLRRHLESMGEYQTVGYAGFFGLPIRYHAAPEAAPQSHCPVLLSAKHDIAETAKPNYISAAHRLIRQDTRNATARDVFKTLKGNVAAAFGLVEATGLASGVAMALRTLVPERFAALRRRLGDSTALSDSFAPALRQRRTRGDGGLQGLSLDEQVFYAQALFALTGLAAPFGRLLVICGHGSTTTNNPYAAALDCGACGGRRGGPNARIMAALLNAPEVRQWLAEKGTFLPDDCIAVAAEHDTATDMVRLFDTELVPASHAADLARLEADLDAAGRRTRQERARRLPGARHADDAAIRSRSVDWAQVRPEWGLAGNAALIVGPRTWTHGVDLGGRCFLHDYDWRRDPGGEALTTILTAPMVVAEWINLQYYFSTVDNDAYGSGDKTTQNVVGGIGVMQGNESDLRTGLPRQSVQDDQGRPYHTPLRLLTVVLAPRDRVATIVQANTSVRNLVDNGWVALDVVDPDTGERSRYQSDGAWRKIAREAAEPAIAAHA